MNLLMFLGGLILLVIGANTLVRGASKLAMSFGISPLVVGLTIVAFGTSAPEVAVSVGAVLDGKTDIAIGNVVGSNIFNVLFILGISALIAPLVVNIQLIRQEVPIMLGASLLLLALSLDGRLSFLDGGFLFVCWWPTPCSWSCSRAARPRPRRTSLPKRSSPPRPVPGTATGRHRSA
jgi:cation:H+ antiporter